MLTILGDAIHGQKKKGGHSAVSRISRISLLPLRHIAIDQGPIVVMIENHRTGLLWDLFMSSPELPPMMNAIGWRREP